jgi:hypothetical protein
MIRTTPTRKRIAKFFYGLSEPDRLRVVDLARNHWFEAFGPTATAKDMAKALVGTLGVSRTKAIMRAVEPQLKARKAVQS